MWSDIIPHRPITPHSVGVHLSANTIGVFRLQNTFAALCLLQVEELKHVENLGISWFSSRSKNVLGKQVSRLKGLAKLMFFWGWLISWRALATMPTFF